MLFASHMDVVMPCLGVRPQVTDGVIHSSGDTVLGADAKASIAAMLEAAAALPGNHPPNEFVFTVGEEVGHLGAKALDISALEAEQAWVLDGLVPVGTIIIGAPTYYSFIARVHGPRRARPSRTGARHFCPRGGGGGDFATPVGTPGRDHYGEHRHHSRWQRSECCASGARARRRSPQLPSISQTVS